jgi:hypothetical protein
MLLSREPIDTLKKQLHIIGIYNTEYFHETWKTAAELKGCA